MTLRDEQIQEIRRLFFAEHWRVGTIAAQLGVHHEAVERVCGLHSPKRVVPPTTPSPLVLYQDFLRQQLERYPRLRATRLHLMLRERGYAGSVRTVREFVRAMRPPPARHVYLRTESLPGEQAQIDWMHVGEVPVPGGRRALWAFVMVLAYSRAMWAELVFDLDVASVRRSLVRACAAFGGSAREWLFDNPKTVVLERVGTLVRFHPGLLETAGAYYAQTRVCGVRRPEHKGKVERSIRYLRDSFFAGRSLVSRERGNEQLHAWIEQTANARPHPTERGKTVREVFSEERTRLLRLPDVAPSTEQSVPVVVDKTASVRFDGNVYSVPPEHAYQTRTLAADDAQVRVLDGASVVALHARCWGRGQRVEERAHRLQIVRDRDEAQEPTGIARLRAAVPQIEVLLARWIDERRNLGGCVARTVRLLEGHGAEVLQRAVAEMVERGTHDFGALSLLCEQQRRGRERAVRPAVQLGPHVREREVTPHAMEGYDER